MHAQIKSKLAFTIYTASPASVDGTGKIVYGTAASRAAWVERESRIVDMRDGTKRQTTHLIIVESSIGDTDRIWLPGDGSTDATKARVPAQVLAPLDATGAVDHYEVRV